MKTSRTPTSHDTWETMITVPAKYIPKTIHYSDGSSLQNAVIVIWDDIHNERAGYFRAFWASAPNATTGSPVIGYCSPGGSQRTIRAVVAEVRRYERDTPIYRHGRRLN